MQKMHWLCASNDAVDIFLRPAITDVVKKAVLEPLSHPSAFAEKMRRENGHVFSKNLVSPLKPLPLATPSSVDHLGCLYWNGL